MVQIIDSNRPSCVPNESLYCVKYIPSKPKAVFCFHHGLSEHIGRYRALFTHLAEDKGIAIYTGDALGHGKSTGMRAYIDSFSHIVADFKSLCEEARWDVATAWPGETFDFFIGGHSLGGLIAALACLESGQETWSGLLLSSPALDVEWTPILKVQAMMGGVLSALLPKARIVPAVRPEDMNQDPVCVQEYINDTLNTIGPLPSRTAKQSLVAFRELKAKSGEFRIPVYCHHGDADRCTSATASKEFMDKIQSTDKTYLVIEGGYHELLIGKRGMNIADGMADWMLARLTQGAASSKI